MSECKFMLNVGHSEYLLDLPEDQLTPLWTYEDVEHFEGDHTVDNGPEWEADLKKAFQDKTGEVPELHDWDVTWQAIYQVDTTRAALEEAMTKLMSELEQDPGGDDGTFDYWPSGVRMAMEVADHLGGDWPQRIADQARAFILTNRADFREELLASVGLE